MAVKGNDVHVGHRLARRRADVDPRLKPAGAYSRRRVSLTGPSSAHRPACSSGVRSKRLAACRRETMRAWPGLTGKPSRNATDQALDASASRVVKQAHSGHPSGTRGW